MMAKKYPPFKKQVDAIFKTEVPRNIGTAVRFLTMEAFARVVMRSPVGNPTLWEDQAQARYALSNGYVGGRFRGNWQVAVGARPVGPVDDIDHSTVGSAPSGTAVAKAVGALAPLRLRPDKAYLVNNLPYAEPLENGSSTQAPGGMVAVTTAELKQAGTQLLKRLSRA